MHSIDHNSFTTFFQNIPLNLHIEKGPNAIITIKMDTQHLFLSHTFAWRWLHAYLSCHLKWTIVGTFCFNFRCLPLSCPFVHSTANTLTHHTDASLKIVLFFCFLKKTKHDFAASSTFEDIWHQECVVAWRAPVRIWPAAKEKRIESKCFCLEINSYVHHFWINNPFELVLNKHLPNYKSIRK